MISCDAAMAFRHKEKPPTATWHPGLINVSTAWRRDITLASKMQTPQIRNVRKLLQTRYYHFLFFRVNIISYRQQLSFFMIVSATTARVLINQGFDSVGL